uniref:Cilia- and flagella-associated protein 69 ARM repeats domain-containing protein n=1 Tax=Schizaphis graminum TaxID=13262 RepID=A0A2S2NKH3_SCHGA
MVFNMVSSMLKMYFDEDAVRNINQNIFLVLLHFIKNAIIRYNDQVELFIKARGIEYILNALTISKYPIQLVMLSTLLDLVVFKSAKCHIKKWKSTKTGKGYLELVCEIWRRELLRFNFIDDEFIFQEQRDATTAKNLASMWSPTVEFMFLFAQPKIYLLVQLVEFAGLENARLHERSGDDFDNDIEENTIRACRLVSGLQDKATVAHIYHYYSLKVGEIWNENYIVATTGNVDGVELSPVISQSADAMAIRHAYLIALITMIKSRVTELHVGKSEIELEKKLYEEIRHYNNFKAHCNDACVSRNALT